MTVKRKEFEYLMCPKDGWVHFAVTRKFAEQAVKEFNEYFKTLSKKDQKLYYGGKGADISSYDRCDLCGTSYENFVPATKVPFGSTIGPIIKE